MSKNIPSPVTLDNSADEIRSFWIALIDKMEPDQPNQGTLFQRAQIDLLAKIASELEDISARISAP